MSAPDDLHERFDDLARAAGPWADPLPAVRRRVRAARRAPTHQRWRPSAGLIGAVAAAAVVVLGLVGVARIHPGSSGGGAGPAVGPAATGPVVAGPSAAPCRVPPATGPLTRSARISVSVSGALTLGAALGDVRVQVASTGAAPLGLRVRPAQLLLLRQGRVVARTPVPAGESLPLTVSATARTVPGPGPGALAGCGGGSPGSGTYRAVAVVAYQTTAAVGVLVSPTIPVRVR